MENRLITHVKFLKLKKMRKYIIIMMILVSVAISSQAQTYTQGVRVIPFNSIANSTLLTSNNRLDMNTAFNKLKILDNETKKKSAREIVGEFWWIDGMLVQIVSRNITSTYPTDDLDKIKYGMRPNISVMESQPRDMTLYNDYFEEFKKVNNFEVLIHYYKTMDFVKNFTIQDNQKKYKVFGSVYTSNHLEAHNLINTILNSISFK